MNSRKTKNESQQRRRGETSQWNLDEARREAARDPRQLRLFDEPDALQGQDELPDETSKKPAHTVRRQQVRKIKRSK